MTPNPHQVRKREQLRRELRRSTALPYRGMSDCGYDFTEVDGVTVVITKRSVNLRGGYKVAAVRTYDETRYPTNLDAAVNAKDLFTKQRARDSEDLEAAREHTTGHLGPKVDKDWRCNDAKCPCAEEDDIIRRKDRSLSGNRKAKS